MDKKPWKKKILDVVLAIIIVYIASMAIMFINQRNLIYAPSRECPQPAAYGVPDMNVMTVTTADKLTLTGWYEAPADPTKPVIILFHGNAGHIGYRGFKVHPFIAAGYGFLLAEYRGYGGNAGYPSEQGFYNDARAYIEALKVQGVAPERIVLYGESLGTGVALQMALDYPEVHAIILESAYTSIADVCQREIFYMPVKWLVRDRFDSLKKIGKVKAPILIVHGVKDSLVPYAMGQSLFAAAKGPKDMVSIPEGGHNDLYDYHAGEKILGFLRSLGTVKKAR
jgi:fermentation-respiration switch protein FrsA (DUF1100 family)